jgi:TonB family protein
MIPELLSGLLRANLAGSLAIGAALLLRKPARRALGAQAAYALWAAPVLAGLAALLPQPSSATALSPLMLSAGVAAARALSTMTGSGLSAAALAVWLTGAAFATGLLAWRQRRYMASTDAGPAVVGALRPRIVTPADFEARFAPAEREVILAHEAAHLARGDAQANALAAAIQCACWFNPLVHLAVRRMRVDQELACDAAVLRRLPGLRRLYAEVLLKTQLAAEPLPLGCHWPAGSAHPLKERITMLRSPPPSRRRAAAGAAGVAAVSLAVACAAWAAQPPIGSLITAPVWTSRPAGADMARVYPPAALRKGLQGRATMTCRVDDAGRLRACRVESESPAGAGFGDAALQIADRFQMTSMSRDGKSRRGGLIRVPFRFKLAS